MTNKGYYGWIHSLNAAGIQAHKKGIEMLAEQHARKGTLLTEEELSMGKAKRVIGKKAQDLAAQLKPNAPAREFGIDLDDAYEGRQGAPIIADQQTAIEAGGGDYSDYSQLRDLRRPSSPNNPTHETIKTGLHRSMRPTFGSDEQRGTIDTQRSRIPSYHIAALERAKTAAIQAGTDVDGDGDNDIDDVLADLTDNKMDAKKHPDPLYPIAAMAHAAVAHLNGWGAAAEAGRDEDEDNRHMSSYTGRSGERYFPESVSQKIARFLRN
jgi:hypothetical protein